MSQKILLNESVASQRIVYLWSVLSNGTTPAANEAGGQPTMSVAGLTKWNSAGTLLTIDATNGEYCVRLGASDVSVLGPGVVRYSSGSALETSIPIQIVAYSVYSSLATFDPSSMSVGLKAQTHSQATVFVGGVDKAIGATSGLSFAPQPGTFSATTLSVGQMDKAVGATSGLSFTPVPGDYSSVVTVGVGNMAKSVGAVSGLSFGIIPGTYSNVSVSVAAMDKAVGATSGLSFVPVPGDYSSTVTVGVSKIKAGTYSAVTIDGLVSNVTVGVVATGAIVAASFAAGAVDATALNSSAENAIADALLARNVAGGSSSGRIVSEAFYALRNKVAVDGSTGTVFQVNDSTSAWTFSIATASVNSGLLRTIDPQ